MAPWLGEYTTPAEDPSSVPGTHVKGLTACSSSPTGSGSFWPLGAPALTFTYPTQANTHTLIKTSELWGVEGFQWGGGAGRWGEKGMGRDQPKLV